MTTTRRTLIPLIAALLLAAGLVLLTGPAAHAAVCVTSSPTGACGPYNGDPNVFTSSNGSDLVVQNDFSSIPQTLTSNGDSNWTVAADTSGQQDQTSVKSYPATQVTYTLPNGLPDPSSDFGNTLTSDFTNVVPTGSNQDYEYAVDDWLADPTKPSWTNDLEIMIWTNTNQQVPAGSPTGQTYTDAAGTSWQVWVAGGGSTVSPDSTISFVRGTIASPNNAVSGTLERMGFYHYLQAQGMLAATYGIDQTNYGLEICSTGGAQRTYGISNYTEVPNGQQQNQAPVVVTNTASGISSAGATLNGSVNPEGQAASYQFDYGTTTSYGTSVPVPAGDAGAGSGSVNENAVLTSLAPGTTYHYRVEATNATGTTLGNDVSFTTSAAGGGGTVSYDATGPGTAGAKHAGSNTLTWAHTVGAGANPALLAEVSVGISNDTGCTLTVKDGTTPMTRLALVHTNGQTAGYLTVWGLAGPPSGANTITATTTGCSGGHPNMLTGGSESFTGVSQSAPFAAAVTSTGYSATPSVTAASTTGDLMAGFVANGNSVSSATAPSTSRFLVNGNGNTGAGNSAGATSAATGSNVTMGWTVTNDWWAATAVQVLAG